MKHQRFNNIWSAVLIVSTFFVSEFALAQDSTDSAESTSDSGSSSGSVRKGLSLRLFSAPGSQSYELKGSGFTGSLGATTSTNQGGSISYIFDSIGIRAQYLNTKVDFKPLAALSPSTIASATDFASLEALVFPNQGSSGWLNSLSIGFGFDYSSRTVTETTPNAILTGSNRTGFRLSAGHEAPIGKQFQFDSDVWLSTPFYFEEPKTKTGYYNFSFVGGLKLMMVYHVSNFIDFAVGFRGRYESAMFRGAGNRGVDGATENYTDMVFPIELRIQL